MDNELVFDALDIVLGSSKSYVGTKEDRAVYTRMLDPDERCISILNFSVAANCFVSALNVVEYIVEKYNGRQYMVGLITCDGELVFRYVSFDNGDTRIDLDIEGQWKKDLILMARVVQYQD